jgi:hypothetical protein
MLFSLECTLESSQELLNRVMPTQSGSLKLGLRCPSFLKIAQVIPMDSQMRTTVAEAPIVTPSENLQKYAFHPLSSE